MTDREHITKDGRRLKVWPWDATIATSKAGLERCMRAMLLTDAYMTDAFRLSGDLGRGTSAFLRVWIPEGHEARFAEICCPQEPLKPPGRFHVGDGPPPDDGHPGRRR